MNKVVTGKVRFSYLFVFEPRATQSGEEKYSATILIPKNDTLTYNNIMNAMNGALEEAIAKVFNGVKPANPKFPIHDGDGLRASGETFGEECKGCWVITASSIDRPEIVDANLNPIISKSEFYSGCYGRASLNFFAYNRNGNKGVGCGLLNIQKLEDGQSLTGRTTASEDFADTTATYQQTLQQNNYVAMPQNNTYQQPVQTQYGTQPQYNVNPITGEPLNNVYGVN